LSVVAGIVPGWRDDVDALIFTLGHRRGACFVHRLAFRRLLGFVPTKSDCLAHFAATSARFVSAAMAKISRTEIPDDHSFHLTSRDICRQADQDICMQARIVGEHDWLITLVANRRHEAALGERERPCA
jgi:hypothetical protein